MGSLWTRNWNEGDAVLKGRMVSNLQQDRIAGNGITAASKPSHPVITASAAEKRPTGTTTPSRLPLKSILLYSRIISRLKGSPSPGSGPQLV